MKYLVTGGTGSFGTAFVKYILKSTRDSVTVFSRDELKQWNMRNEIKDKRLSFCVGDVRDRESLFQAIQGHGRVIHAAALKHVHTGEEQPRETILTNIIGTENVAEICKGLGAEMVLLSTDKAVAPVNLYGASKMSAEYLTLKNGHRVVRYGNIFHSRGSVLHVFKKEAARGNVFTITDRRMTRFIVTFEQAIQTVMDSFDKAPGTVTIPDIPSIRITDLALAFDEKAEFREIGMQPGEKLAEVLQLDPYIGSDTAPKLTVEQIRRLIDETV